MRISPDQRPNFGDSDHLHPRVRQQVENILANADEKTVVEPQPLRREHNIPWGWIQAGAAVGAAIAALIAGSHVAG